MEVTVPREGVKITVRLEGPECVGVTVEATEGGLAAMDMRQNWRQIVSEAQRVALRTRPERAPAPKGPDGRRAFPPDHLLWVARTYAAAVQAGIHNPTAFVAEQAHERYGAGPYRKGQVGKWVERARRAGWLTPAPGHRKGGGTLTGKAREA